MQKNKRQIVCRRNHFIGGITVMIVVFFLATIASSCKKNLIYSKGNLAFSKDTVVFDTVFTTIGSTTKRLKIYNRSSSTVRISEIELMGGASSPFRINVDGLQGRSFANIEMEGRDSLRSYTRSKRRHTTDGHRRLGAL